MPKPEDTEGQEALEKELTGSEASSTDAGKPGKETPEPTEKGKEGAPAAEKAEDDPEIDLGTEGKVKRSQVLGWKKSGMLEEDYRKKTEDLSAKEKELENLAHMSDYLAKNPKKLQKVLAILQEAEDAADAAKEGTGTKKASAEAAGEAKDAIEAVLENLDPEDPAGQILKAILGEVRGLSKKVKEVEEKELKQSERQTQQQQAEAVTQLRKVLNDTIDEHSKTMEFGTDQEKEVWRQMVLSTLKDARKSYSSKEEFVAAVKAIGDATGKKIKAMVEANLKKYHEGKKGPTLPGPGAGGAAAPKTITMDNLQDGLEKELEAIVNKT